MGTSSRKPFDTYCDCSDIVLGFEGDDRSGVAKCICSGNICNTSIKCRIGRVDFGEEERVKHDVLAFDDRLLLEI